MEQVVLDLGEYGMVIVEPDEANKPSAMGVVDTGIGENIRRKVTVNAQEALQRTLQGLAHVFVSSLPPEEVSNRYQLDTFSVEFQMGFGAEAGVSTGVVMKIAPSGAFKCSYTWKAKQPKLGSE